MKDNFTRIADILLAELKKQYSDISEFIKRSEIPLSFETVRRLLYEKKKVSTPTLIIVAKYLGFSPARLKEMLQQIGDKDFSALIGDQIVVGVELMETEKALLEVYSLIKSKNAFADYLELIARADGVDISKQLIKLRRKGGK